MSNSFNVLQNAKPISSIKGHSSVPTLTSRIPVASISDIPGKQELYLVQKRNNSCMRDVYSHVFLVRQGLF